MKNGNKKLVFVGVSGGVDSSVSAALLKDAGYDVVGVFIRTWTPEWIECTWRDERRDAMRVCAQLDIPFLECDAVDAYKEGVADYMIAEYRAGRVPNPDVMCNRQVKWGALWDFAKSHGADFIATGHYAQVKKNGDRFELHASVSKEKEQSYFLWTLTSDDLSHTLFPIGHLEKSEVRAIAEKYGLQTAQKKDSQGICFLGEIDLKKFLKQYISIKPGDVVNEQGQKIGHHDGVVFHTLGERHGFTITEKSPTDGAYYVIAKDIEKNILIVSQNYQLKNSTNQISKIELEHTNWIVIPESGKTYQAQIRYHGEFLPCTITVSEHNKAEVSFQKEVIVAPGQSCVVYDGMICLGGGIRA